MPTLTEDFLSPYFFRAIFDSVANGMLVLIFLSLLAVFFTFASGATAARHWPKKDDEHAPATAGKDGAQPVQ